MKRRLAYIWYLPIGILSLVTACTERIEIELDSTYRRLVVEGAVTSDSVRHQVILTMSSNYFSNQPAPRISHALVELSFGGETLLLTERDGEPGCYETPLAFRGVPGTTYDLHISQVDVNSDGEEESYSASSTMPGGAELHEIELRYFQTPVVSGYQVQMFASHPLDQRDWFGFKLIKNSDLLTDSLVKYSVISDDLFDTGYFPGLPVGFLSDDNPREEVTPGDTITLEMDCIDQAYYYFVSDAQIEIAGYNPLFSGPPANVYSNIEGAQGIFAAYSIQRTSLIIPTGTQ
jgi:hypothetical protein